MNSNYHLLLPAFLFSLVLAGCIPENGTTRKISGDPLPSWNSGLSKTSIVEFVEATTEPSGPSYIAVDQRIAVFDNDGTLWAEKPIYFQAAFAFDRVRVLAPGHPEWRQEQPFQAVLEGDREYLGRMHIPEALALLSGTHTDLAQEEFDAIAADWLEEARHPRYDRLYKEVVYQPMLELLDYLRANDFKTFIVTGGGVDFVRQFSAEVYGIPQDQVIGSSPKFEFEEREGASVVVRKAELGSFNDKEAKPANIELHIGQRPVIAVGNSDGDLAMLTYAADRHGPSLSILVHHDDQAREYEYDKGTEKALVVAGQRDWTVVSIADDWNRVFPFN